MQPTVEQGKTGWSKITAEIEYYPGDTRQSSICGKKRDLALFNPAIDSKLRRSDRVKIKISDVYNSDAAASRAVIGQK